jgi:uncharacterized protein YbjT (DUF2867 family)
MTTNETVIVFGPTGAVGGAAAIEARKRGAHVWLAMRDTSKEIQGFDSNAEGYSRVEADLTKPETLKGAVSKSGAKTAFTYAIFQSSDSMRASFQALKDAGITYVVMLSSFTVHGDARGEYTDMIGKIHANTEISLQDSGIKHTAIRPAFFANNVNMWYHAGLRKGEVEVAHPTAKFDYISQTDIGTVCGAILANPDFQTLDEGSNAKSVYLCGPELMTQTEAMDVISKGLGREIKVKEVSQEQWVANIGIPHMKLALEGIGEGMKENIKTDGRAMYPEEMYAQSQKNMKKYLGREPTTFSEWVKQNKAAFD